jgi:hypothetical protein
MLGAPVPVLSLSKDVDSEAWDSTLLRFHERIRDAQVLIQRGDAKV